MDEQKIGILSTDNLNVKDVSDEILNFYIPLISELHEFNESLNLEEFIKISDAIFSVRSFCFLF